MEDVLEKILEEMKNIRKEVQDTKQELRGDIQGVRQDLHEEIQGVKQELHEEIQGVKQELHEEIQGVRQELHEEIQSKIDQQSQEIADELNNIVIYMERRDNGLKKEIDEIKEQNKKILEELSLNREEHRVFSYKINRLELIHEEELKALPKGEDKFMDQY